MGSGVEQTYFQGMAFVSVERISTSTGGGDDQGEKNKRNDLTSKKDAAYAIREDEANLDRKSSY